MLLWAILLRRHTMDTTNTHNTPAMAADTAYTPQCVAYGVCKQRYTCNACTTLGAALKAASTARCAAIQAAFTAYDTAILKAIKAADAVAKGKSQ